MSWKPKGESEHEFRERYNVIVPDSDELYEKQYTEADTKLRFESLEERIKKLENDPSIYFTCGLLILVTVALFFTVLTR